MAYETIKAETRGRVGLITLNRPKAMNALSQLMMREICQAAADFDSDAKIGAIVLTLRTYGAIVVDRAEVPTLYAQRDVTADLIQGNELQGLTLDDFEVVQLGQRYPYPPVEGTDR